MILNIITVGWATRLPMRNLIIFREGKVLTSNEIRKAFIDFFKERDHRFIPSAPVVPIGDATLLFTNAGMNQYKDIFLGLSKPQCARAANSQKCIRVSGKHNDLEEVGIDTYHHTFFEMLGNWSFGDYFKAEAIEWAWQLLTDVYKIDPDKLWATVFEGDEKDGSAPDDEAAELWKRLTTLPKERILYCSKKDNFWEMGETGPCGPCSDIHIALGPGRCEMGHVPGHTCVVNAGCARFIELWNLVFIQFNRQPDGKLIPLKAKYVDTGAGLERITALLQGKQSNYDTDLFMPIINALERMTGCKYTSKLGNKTDNAFRVIADHVRTIAFSITDGVTPSNDGRGYVIRRILRRASRFGRVLNVHEPFMYKLVDVLVETMGQAYPGLADRADFAKTVIQSEEESFGRTLDRGLEIFANAAEQAKGANSDVISGENAFQLYDTFGFPLDLTELMARERDLKVDTKKFDELMEQQRSRARASKKTASLAMDLSGVELPVTDDSAKYESDLCQTKILGWIDSNGFTKKGVFAEKDKNVALILKATCFYAESGGQLGDSGKIESEHGHFVVETTERIADCVIHRGQLISGSITVGDKVTATVDRKRSASKKNHTATHILQWALQYVLGDSVKQQGSLVCPEYLRFDFTWPKSLTDGQVEKVNELITEKIEQAYPVTCTVMPINDAKQLGAMALFGEKYGDKVRVIGIGQDDIKDLNKSFSLEFCGGTHVTNTNQIGGFRIIKEESISAGVRRITAYTGPGLNEYLSERSRIIDALSTTLKVPADQIAQRVGKLLDDNKKLAKELRSGGGVGAANIKAEFDALLANAETIGDVTVVVGSVSPAPIEQIRKSIDSLKKKAKSAAIVIGVPEDDSKVMLIASMTDDVVKKGVKAGDIVKQIAPIVGGGGGGRPQMAQAGGKDPAKLTEALDKAIELIKNALSE